MPMIEIDEPRFLPTADRRPATERHPGGMHLNVYPKYESQLSA